VASQTAPTGSDNFMLVLFSVLDFYVSTNVTPAENFMQGLHHFHTSSFYIINFLGFLPVFTVLHITK
jgi:hypothetical protein